MGNDGLAYTAGNSARRRFSMEHRPINSPVWFEYHCWESMQSGDSHLWLRSHTRVTIIALSNADDVPQTRAERIEDGNPLVYRVRFADGFEGDVFEDEMLDRADEFERPDPPTFGA